MIIRIFSDKEIKISEMLIDINYDDSVPLWGFSDHEGRKCCISSSEFKDDMLKQIIELLNTAKAYAKKELKDKKHNE